MLEMATTGREGRLWVACLLLLEVLVFGLTAWVTSFHFPLWDTVKIMLAMLVAYAVPRFVLERSQWVSMPVRTTFIALGMLLVMLSAYNIWLCTAGSGHTLAMPALESDSKTYFKWASHYYDGSCPAPKTVHFFGLPVMMLTTWILLGQNITWAFAVNLMFTLLSIVMFGMMGTRLLQNRVKAAPNKVMFWVMFISCFLGFYYSQAIAIQKEAMNYFGIASTGYVMAGMAVGGSRTHAQMWREFALFVLGSFVLIFTRANMAYFVLAGLVLVVVDNRRMWRWSVACAAVVVIFSYFGMYVFAHDAQIDHQLRVVAGAWGGGDMTNRLFLLGSSQAPLKHILGDYFHYSVLHKALLLPVTVTSQFLIPFPWFTAEPATFHVMMCRSTYIWYIVGGICLFYYGAFSWRKGNGLGAVAFWPLIAYCATAYATGGSLVRYTLPFQPAFAILAVYVLLHLREDKRWRKPFVLWTAVYAVALAATLIVCYHVQMSYLQPV